MLTANVRMVSDYDLPRVLDGLTGRWRIVEPEAGGQVMHLEAYGRKRKESSSSYTLYGPGFEDGVEIFWVSENELIVTYCHEVAGKKKKPKKSRRKEKIIQQKEEIGDLKREVARLKAYSGKLEKKVPWWRS